MGCLLFRNSSDRFGAIPVVLPAMPLLPAEHAVGLLIGVDFFQYAINSIRTAFRDCWHSFVSFSSVRNRIYRCAGFNQFCLPIGSGSEAVSLSGRLGDRAFHLTLDRFRPVRVRLAFATRQFACTIWRSLDSICNRVHIRDAANRNCDSLVHFRVILDVTGQERWVASAARLTAG